MIHTIEKANSILRTNYINWGDISCHQSLSEDFIREFKDNVDWLYISGYQHLSEDFIREFEDKVYWLYISAHQHLSEDFIREFKDKVVWECISKYQRLSEDFIREFKDNVHWGWISIYQHLSEGFIREFKDKVDWLYISAHQHLSEDFIREFKDNINWRWIKNSWLYKDAEFKKKTVMETGLYECHDDYFIAYKGIRSDRWSKFNFQYHYEKNGVYETWCDCSNSANSFGLSAWTEEKARDYCDELVVRVKIKYEDVGRVVHNGGKIRCFRFEVLD